MLLFLLRLTASFGYFEPTWLNASSPEDTEDIFRFLRNNTLKYHHDDNLTRQGIITIVDPGMNDKVSSEKKGPWAIVQDPITDFQLRYVSTIFPDDFENNPAYIIFNFHQMRLTLNNISILYVATLPRMMDCWRWLGQTGVDEWEEIDSREHCKPDDSKHINGKFWMAHYPVRKTGTYSVFKLENFCPDTYTNNPYPHANAVSISKLLFFGKIEVGKIKISPIKLDRNTQYLLNFAMYAAAS